MYTFTGLQRKKGIKILCDVLKLLKAHLCSPKSPGEDHLQSIMTSQSGVTLVFISRQCCECGRRLACAQLWAVLPVVGGEFEVLGKKGRAFTVNEAL